MASAFVVEINGTAIRVFATRELADRFVECCLTEYDEEIAEFRFSPHDLYIATLPFDEK